MIVMVNTLVDCQCPYCWENLSIQVDPILEDQEFVEDCQVCCQPIQFSISYDEQNDEFLVESFKTH